MKKNIAKALICGGLLLFAAAFALTAYNVWDDRRAEKAASDALEIIISEIPESMSQEHVPDYIIDPEMDMPTIPALDEEYVGIIDIEAIDLHLPVINDWNYDNMKLGPCRYEGSAYTDNMIIMAHDYWSHFRELSSLSVGDRVVFTDCAGNTFYYTVADFEVISGNDYETMTESEWDLTLFTCTVSGRSRYTVRCERTDD